MDDTCLTMKHIDSVRRYLESLNPYIIHCPPESLREADINILAEMGRELPFMKVRESKYFECFDLNGQEVFALCFMPSETSDPLDVKCICITRPKEADDGATTN